MLLEVENLFCLLNVVFKRITMRNLQFMILIGIKPLGRSFVQIMFVQTNYTVPSNYVPPNLRQTLEVLKDEIMGLLG